MTAFNLRSQTKNPLTLPNLTNLFLHTVPQMSVFEQFSTKRELNTKGHFKSRCQKRSVMNVILSKTDDAFERETLKSI